MDLAWKKVRAYSLEQEASRDLAKFVAASSDARPRWIKRADHLEKCMMNVSFR